MRISVVIPVYNRISLLQKAIDSILSQTIQPYEIIVVDDGSTDNAQGIIKTKYPQIKYIYQENQGVSSARNTGIKHSSGDYIALLDSDDTWEKEKLEKHINFIIENPNFRVSQTDEKWIRNGKFVNPKKKHKKLGGKIFIPSLELCLVSPSAVMIEKTVFDDFGVFDTSLPACEDYDLWLRVSAFEEIGLLEEKLTVKYGGHDDQLSHKFKAMDGFRVYAIEKVLKENLSDNYREAAINTLKRKCEILINGYQKRENIEKVKYFSKILKKY